MWSLTIATIKKYHAQQKRGSGEPFYLHPIEVAIILLDFTQDEDAVIAALLHDVVEDTLMTLLQVQAMFGPVVASLVDGVTKFEHGPQRVNLSPHEIIQKVTEQENELVFYIKIADRLHNMRTIQTLPSLNKRKQIAEETLQFFIPIAQQMGLQQVKEELKALVFDALHKDIIHSHA